MNLLKIITLINCILIKKRCEPMVEIIGIQTEEAQQIYTDAEKACRETSLEIEKKNAEIRAENTEKENRRNKITR